MQERRYTRCSTQSNKKSKARRQSVTFKSSSYPETNDNRHEEKEQMDVDAGLDSNTKQSADRKFKKPGRKGGTPTSLISTLIANNRALAAAHEKVELELRSVQLQNVQLNKQFLATHEKFVEKTSDMEQQVQSLKQLVEGSTDKATVVVCKNVHNLLQEACTQFLCGSNHLSDALHLVNNVLNPLEGHVTFSIQNQASPHLTFNNVSSQVIIDHMTNSICTTPPPDEPSAMELTATQSVIIEGADIMDISIDKAHDHFKGKKEQDKCFIKKGKENINPLMESDAMKAMDVDEAQAARGRKRRSCVGITYTEPGLRSKLRRGDPFTDSSLFTDLPSPKRVKRKRALTGSMTVPIKRKRIPLTNLTNVIAEEV